MAFRKAFVEAQDRRSSDGQALDQDAARRA
jgi:hypothetical protein